MPDEGSEFEYRRQHGQIENTLERWSETGRNLIGRGRAITTSAKRRLYETGIVGRATILKSPRAPDANAAEPEGRFLAIIELPGKPSYEIKVWQSYTALEWRRLQPGMVVECRVDADDPRKILLCAEESAGPAVTRQVSATDISATGRRAIGAVTESAPVGKLAPGTNDDIYVITLILSDPAMSPPWNVRILQRVPRGFEHLVQPGQHVHVAYLAVDGGDSVAILWPT